MGRARQEDAARPASSRVAEPRGSRPVRAVGVRLFFLMALAGMAVGAAARANDADHAVLGDNPAFDAPSNSLPTKSAEAPRTYIPLRPAGPDEVEQQLKPGQGSSFGRWSRRPGPQPAAPADSGANKKDPPPNTVFRVGTDKATGPSLSMAPRDP